VFRKSNPGFWYLVVSLVVVVKRVEKEGRERDYIFYGELDETMKNIIVVYIFT